MIKKNIILTPMHSQILSNIIHTTPQPTHQLSPFQNTQNYYGKAFIENLIYNQNLKTILQTLQQITHLKKSIQLVPSKISVKANHKNQKTRLRRTADQIQKKYKCNQVGCYKTYGSDASLNLHKKLKHRVIEIRKEDSDQMVQNINWQCQQKIKQMVCSTEYNESQNVVAQV